MAATFAIFSEVHCIFARRGLSFETGVNGGDSGSLDDLGGVCFDTLLLFTLLIGEGSLGVEFETSSELLSSSICAANR